jgi:hypothetical protein
MSNGYTLFTAAPDTAHVNVRTMGAVGNGVHDDTTAIQAAINALPAAGGVVYLPAGTYKITNVLTVRSNLTVVGDHMTATQIVQANAAKQAFYGADITGGLTIRDMRLTGPSNGVTPGTSDAVLLEKVGIVATQNIVIENVYIDHWSRHGLFIDDPITSTFTNVRVQTCAGEGFHIATGTSLTFESCYANACAGGGYRLTSTSYSNLTGCAADSCTTGYLLVGCNNVSLVSCGAEALSGNGYTIDGGNGNTLLSCYSSGNTAIGFRVTGAATRAVLTNAWERNPTGSPTASIKVDSGCSATVLTPTVATAADYAAGTTNVFAAGQLDITSAGTSINSVDRAANTNFAAYVLRTANVDRWAIQMVNNSTNDLRITDSATGNTALTAETRATNTNLQLLSAVKAFGGGVGVIGIADSATTPSTNPAGGGVLYVESGVLKWLGSSGTATDLTGYTSSLVTSGEETFSREVATSSSVAVATQSLRLAYFTARKTETTTQVRVITGGTAAAATPTICRIGLYSIAANGNGSLVASTANDTALFAGLTTAYTRSWTTPYAKVAGTRYALGILVVSGAATPTFVGQSIGNAAEAAVAPALSAALTGQSDLPSSFTAGALTTTGNRNYGVILP